jgi:transglutaminase-like putative cysteine protease
MGTGGEGRVTLADIGLDFRSKPSQPRPTPRTSRSASSVRKRGTRIQFQRPAPILLLALVGLILLCGVFFVPIYTGQSYLLRLAAVVAICFGLILLCDRRRITAGFAALLHIAAFLLTGPALVSLDEAPFGVLPSPQALQALVRGVIVGPANLLTTPLPARPAGALLLVPVLGTWISFVAGWLLLRNSLRRSALFGPGLLLLLALLFGARDQRALRLVTLFFLFGSLAYIAVVQRVTSATAIKGRTSRSSAWKTVLAPAFITLAALVLAAGLAPSLSLSNRSDRFTLRTYREPPFDPSALPSPLASFRKYRTAALLNKELFEVEGEVPERFRLATLDAYDGRVWSVGGDQDQSGRFSMLGERLDVGAPDATLSGPLKKTGVTVTGLSEPWLPTAGPTARLSVPGNRDARDQLRRNVITDSIVWTTTPQAISYELQWREQAVVALDANSVADRSNGIYLQLPTDVPEELTGLVDRVLDDAESDVQKAQLLQDFLRSGYYSLNHPTGHSLGNLSRLTADSTRMIGNDEQFVAAYAVLARVAGLPSRVVVGFVPPPATPSAASTAASTGPTPIAVRGQDLQVWAEVRFADHGWVPFTATPPASREPRQIEVSSEENLSTPQTAYDPEPQPREADAGQITAPQPIPPTVESKPNPLLRWLIIAGVVIGAPLALLGLTLAAITGAKSLRRRRRRHMATPGQQIAGAWHEALDRLQDSGRTVARTATFHEAATLLAEDDTVRPQLLTLAQAAERAAFHPVRPTDNDAQSVWTQVDQLRDTIDENQNFKQSVLAKFALGSLTSTRSPRVLRAAQPLVATS